MIYFRHKETGFVVSHKDLKEKYDEVKEKGIYNYKVTFIAPYKLLPYEEEILKSENKMYEYNILESSIITDHDLIKKIRPIIQKKINIEKILNKF